MILVLLKSRAIDLCERFLFLAYAILVTAAATACAGPQVDGEQLAYAWESHSQPLIPDDSEFAKCVGRCPALFFWAQQAVRNDYVEVCRREANESERPRGMWFCRPAQ